MCGLCAPSSPSAVMRIRHKHRSRSPMCCFQFPPAPESDRPLLSRVGFPCHECYSIFFSFFFFFVFSLSLSLSLSILVQRISKSSLNPRGPLTKTLGTLTNLGVLASLFLIGENSKIRKWIDFWRFSTARNQEKKLVKIAKFFYIWFWVCSQRHEMVWFIAKFG